MQSVDFSCFTPEALRAIETAARLAVNCGGNVVTPCHLVGGLASVNGDEVCSALKDNGFDPDSSMEAVARGMSEPMPARGGDGVTFSPDVEDVFVRASSHDEPATVAILIEELLDAGDCPLGSYLVKISAPQGVVGHLPGDSRGHRTDIFTNGGAVRKYCVNMLELAAEGKLAHAIGRDEEVSRVLLILARSDKNNPVLVGEAGTGKTAIAEELAIRLSNGQVPSDMTGLKLYRLDFMSIKSLPDSVKVMRMILDDASKDPSLVLFIDEIHTLISACDCSGNDISNLLKPAMARGGIKILGATTIDEYKRIEKDPAFERRFQKVIVNEPDMESAIKILQGIKGKYETYHNVRIPDEVCEAAVTLSARYITNRRLPDKAIDLMDEASANLRLDDGGRRVLEVNDVKKVVTAWTGIPVDNMDADETRKLQSIEQELHSSVVGQDKAIKAVSAAIKRNRMGFGDASRPVGSFLFLGPTGTGKTELCKAIAKFLFNDPNQIVRIDMSEYQQEHSSHRLFGAPPGYVGYDQGGQLTEAVSRKPFSVVLFDEVEKAHPKILETLLQVLDDGRMTDGKGKVVNFKNTIIVMTSNIGQRIVIDALCGRQATVEEIEECTQAVVRQLRTRVAPEFINRVDNIVMFLPLTKEELTMIAEMNIKKEMRLLEGRGVSVVIDPEVVGFIVEHGYQPEFGARPIKRAINDFIMDPLSSEIVDGTVDMKKPIRISVSDNKIIIENVSSGRV